MVFSYSRQIFGIVKTSHNLGSVMSSGGFNSDCNFAFITNLIEFEVIVALLLDGGTDIYILN
jgi:hypothetical protein